MLPAFFLIMGLSWTYVVHGDVSWIGAVFYSLQAAVIVLVAAAVIRVGSKALTNPVLVGIAASAFVAIFFVKVPLPLFVLCAAAIGLVGSRIAPRVFQSSGHGESDDDSVLGDALDDRVKDKTGMRTLRVLALGLLSGGVHCSSSWHYGAPTTP